MEVVANLHWIEGQQSNIFLWTGEEGLLLIDAGMPGDAQWILEYITDLGYEPGDLKGILLTHADVDHVGAAAALQAASGATVYAGAETAALLSKGKSAKHMPWLSQFIIDHFLKFPAVPVDKIQILEEEKPIPGWEEWQALATPGHTNDHLSFFNPIQSILFTGDAVNNRRDNFQISPNRISSDPEAARESAIRLLRLEAAVIACGHGRPLYDYNPAEMLTLYRALDQQTT